MSHALLPPAATPAPPSRAVASGSLPQRRDPHPQVASRTLKERESPRGGVCLTPPLSRQPITACLSGAGPLEGVGRGLAHGGAWPHDLLDLVEARPCGLLQPGLICVLPAASNNCDRGFHHLRGEGAQPSNGPTVGGSEPTCLGRAIDSGSAPRLRSA